MPIYLKQSTASQEVPLGYFVSSTDGNTEQTGLTIANTDIKVWKAGATALVSKNSGGGTHMSNGIYYAVLDATDTNTLGSLVLFAHLTGALPVRVECVVLPPNVYEAMINNTEWLETSGTRPTMSVAGGSLTVRAKDGTTAQYTKTVTTTPGANPVTALS